MNEAVWVFAANAVVWLGLGLYLTHLHRAQARLAARLRHLNLRLQGPDL